MAEWLLGPGWPAVFNFRFLVYRANARPPGGQNVRLWLFQLPIF
jgi:hypothetical protein